MTLKALEDLNRLILTGDQFVKEYITKITRLRWFHKEILPNSKVLKSYRPHLPQSPRIRKITKGEVEEII